jgi:hypothetical protein
MKAQLIKKAEGWYNLYQDKIGIGSTYPELQGYKLSKQNCDEIFGVTDVEKLAEERFGKSLHHANSRSCYKEGFNKAMELNKDKRFTSRDMLSAYIQGTNDGAQFESLLDYDSEDFDEAHEFAKETEREFIQSLQQPTEIEVEIETESMNIDEIREQGKGFLHGNTKKPKLDENGCLILKK